MSRSPRQTALAALLALGVAVAIGSSCVVRSWHSIRVNELVYEQEGRERPLELWVTTTDKRVLTGEFEQLGEQGMAIRTEQGIVDLPLAEIASIQVRLVDTAASVFATLAVGAGVAAAAYLVVGFVALLLKTSCPFVYLLLPDGSAVLLGETYSGAVYKALERDDLLELPVVEGEALHLRLASEAHEEHHTDKAVLWLVEHLSGQRAVATHDARAVVVGSSQAPVSAVDLEGRDQLGRLLEADQDAWLTDMDAAATAHPSPVTEGLVLRFEAVPDGAHALELVAANTPWQDVVAAHLWSATGHRLDDVQGRFADDDPDTRARLERWRRAAGVDLRVERRDGDGWTTVAWVPPQGWAHTRHVVVPVEAMAGALELRLTGGVGFWLVDQVALAPVLDDDPAMTELAPASAMTWDGRDEAAALAATDGQVQLLPHKDTWVDLAWTLPPAAEGQARTAFLATRGWYAVLPRHDGPPHRRSMARIARHPDQASAMSLELWQTYRERFGHIDLRVVDASGVGVPHAPSASASQR